MPGIDQTTLEQSKTKYLDQDRSVNLQKHLDKQEKLEKSGLENIEIRDKAKQLGKDDFLQLLVKQLTHQDPTAPIKDQAFIAQMAQFSSLEQMQNMAQSINKLSDRQAMDVVGKFVMAKDFVSGQPVTGIARALFFDHSGQAFLKVSGKNVAIKDIQLIGDPSNFKREFGGTAGPAGAAAQPAVAPPQLAPTRTAPGAASSPTPEVPVTPAAPVVPHTQNTKGVPGATSAGPDTRAGAVSSEAAAAAIMSEATPKLPGKKAGASPAGNVKPEQTQDKTKPGTVVPGEQQAPVSFVEMIRDASAGRAFQA